jgi:hypothetical protein
MQKSYCGSLLTTYGSETWVICIAQGVWHETEKLHFVGFTIEECLIEGPEAFLDCLTWYLVN